MTAGRRDERAALNRRLGGESVPLLLLFFFLLVLLLFLHRLGEGAADAAAQADDAQGGLVGERQRLADEAG